MSMNADWQPILKGTRVKLRPLVQGDFDALFTAASDPLIWEQHPERNRYQREVFEKFFQGAIDSKGALLALDADTDRVIGTSRYYDFDSRKKSVVIGYTFLIRDCWGRAYNNDMKKLMLDYAFLFVDEVLFHIGERNLRSRKAIERIGAQLVGKLDLKLANGQDNPSVLYQIMRQ